MNITITIKTDNETELIQSIGTAMGTTGTDREQQGHLTEKLTKITRDLYNQGAEQDDLKAKRDGYKTVSDRDITSV